MERAREWERGREREREPSGLSIWALLELALCQVSVSQSVWKGSLVVFCLWRVSCTFPFSAWKSYGHTSSDVHFSVSKDDHLNFSSDRVHFFCDETFSLPLHMNTTPTCQGHRPADSALLTPISGNSTARCHPTRSLGFIPPGYCLPLLSGVLPLSITSFSFSIPFSPLPLLLFCPVTPHHVGL